MPKTDAEKREAMIRGDHHIQVTQERTFCSGILSVTTTFRLLVTGNTDLRELEKIIRILKLQKDILEEADAEAAHAPEASAGENETPQQGEVQGGPQAEGRADGEQQTVTPSTVEIIEPTVAEKLTTNSLGNGP